MKIASHIIGILMCIVTVPGIAASLDLDGYQSDDGAITVAYRGDFVDPYFAMRALLTANQAGLDISLPARAWIGWLLPRQKANGIFTRYCRHSDENWLSCADADADDALLATWVELLYVMAPCTGLPQEWEKSVNLSSWQMGLLYNKKNGIYYISEKNQVGLLMDNVEIYASLRAISKKQKCMGLQTESRRVAAAATHLRQAIDNVFRPLKNEPFRVSTQAVENARFYPEQVGQIYPSMYGMLAMRSTRIAFQNWMQVHGSEWLRLNSDVYPWGLIAVMAQTLGDGHTANCWSTRASKLRHGKRWNVLEEASFQSINRTTHSLPCQNESES
jgi:hypothetical protein